MKRFLCILLSFALAGTTVGCATNIAEQKKDEKGPGEEEAPEPDADEEAVPEPMQEHKKDPVDPTADGLPPAPEPDGEPVPAIEPPPPPPPSPDPSGG